MAESCEVDEDFLDERTERVPLFAELASAAG
jgi:hypothetical protein